MKLIDCHAILLMMQEEEISLLIKSDSDVIDPCLRIDLN